MPYFFGKRQYSKAEQVKNTVFSGISVIILFISAGLLFASFFLSSRYSPQTILGLRITAIIIIFQQIHYFFTAYLRAEKDFSLINKVNLFYAIIKLAAIVSLIFFFKLNGVLAALLIAHIAMVFYIQLKKKYKFKFSINISQIIKLIRFGFPLYLIAFGYVC